MYSKCLSQFSSTSYFSLRSAVKLYGKRYAFTKCFQRHSVNVKVTLLSSQCKVSCNIGSRMLKAFCIRGANSLSNSVHADCKKVELDLDALFPLRFLYIDTSVGVWEDYPTGVEFDVGYVDSKEGSVQVKETLPVILGLPSTVGSHTELTDRLKTFAKLGYRVIILNMPGSFLCRGRTTADESIFTFTVQEKADFVKDFLLHLGIKSVGMLVTSSCSVYTGMYLCVHYHTMFKSFVMINPTGLEKTKNMKHFPFQKVLKHVWDRQYFMQPVFIGIIFFLKLFTQKRSWSTRNIITYIRTMTALSFVDTKKLAEDLSYRTIPKFAVYGADSWELNQASTIELLQLIGIPQSSVTVYDQNNNVVRQGNVRWY